MTGGHGNETFCARPFLLDGACFLLELQAGTERWESHEKRMNDELDDEERILTTAVLTDARVSALESAFVRVVLHMWASTTMRDASTCGQCPPE